MSQPYVGEIRMFGGNFAPAGWALCNGQLMPIADNDVLFNLIGTTYGGDGQNTFGLPDFRGRVPVHMGSGYTIGQLAGSETVTLTTQQIPVHTHVPQANSASQADTPNGNVWATASGTTPYEVSPGNAQMNNSILQQTGGSQPHDNMIPYLVVNYIISLYGVYPSQN